MMFGCGYKRDGGTSNTCMYKPKYQPKINTVPIVCNTRASLGCACLEVLNSLRRFGIQQLILAPLNTLDTIGNCQRPVFSFGVSQHMHKITNL